MVTRGQAQAAPCSFIERVSTAVGWRQQKNSTQRDVAGGGEMTWPKQASRVELLAVPGVVHHQLAGTELLAVLVGQTVHHVRIYT